MTSETRPQAVPSHPGAALYWGYAVEGGLGLLAAAVAWWADMPLLEEVRFSLEALGWGLAATLPMLASLLALARLDWPPIVRIRQIVQAFARQMLLGASWTEIAVLCVLAGVGEELLFRGVIQTVIAERTSPAAGILLAGILFGAVHFLTTTYFILGAAVGCYLGWLYVWTASLAAPIVAHAVYDFLALVIVLDSVRREEHSEQSVRTTPE